MARIVARSVVFGLLVGLAACGPSPTKVTDDGSTMILIPAGEFQMGGLPEDVAGQPDAELLTYHAERPQHKVGISAFYIDKFEVTTAQYRAFLEANEGSPGKWDHTDQPTDKGHEPRYVTENLMGADQPAVGISWYDANAYCRWAGKRMLTEAEWEYAARGSKGARRYPWGDEAPNADGIWWANYRPESGAEADGFRSSSPVGSYPDGVSPFGVVDMSGNAEEWVQDWYSINYYARSQGVNDPPGPLNGDRKVIKGGSYEAAAYQIRIAMRLYGRPYDKGPRLGIRCAMNP